MSLRLVSSCVWSLRRHCRTSSGFVLGKCSTTSSGPIRAQVLAEVPDVSVEVFVSTLNETFRSAAGSSFISFSTLEAILARDRAAKSRRFLSGSGLVASIYSSLVIFRGGSGASSSSTMTFLDRVTLCLRSTGISF